MKIEEVSACTDESPRPGSGMVLVFSDPLCSEVDSHDADLDWETCVPQPSL